jgi:hypothetical protein
LIDTIDGQHKEKKSFIFVEVRTVFAFLRVRKTKAEPVTIKRNIWSSTIILVLSETV